MVGGPSCKSGNTVSWGMQVWPRRIIWYNTSLNTVPLIRVTDVRVLRFRHSNITLSERDSFVSRGLTELEILQVGWCELRTIELGAFNGLTKSTKLYINFNKISEIIPGTFENMSNLKYLDLRPNSLKQLDGRVFRGLVNLKSIYLGNNKLQFLTQIRW
jgi:Leucine-rich repeat (LRR) protein